MNRKTVIPALATLTTGIVIGMFFVATDADGAGRPNPVPSVAPTQGIPVSAPTLAPRPTRWASKVPVPVVPNPTRWASKVPVPTVPNPTRWASKVPVPTKPVVTIEPAKNCG